MFTKMLNLFGVTGATVINTVGIIVLSLIIIILVSFLFGEPMIPVAYWLGVIVPLIAGTPWIYIHFKYLEEITRRREELTRMNQKLVKALSEVKELCGLLPICSHCKKIRDDRGYWNQLESYIRDHSKAEFSHSFCPDCAERHYPEYYKKN